MNLLPKLTKPLRALALRTGERLRALLNSILDFDPRQPAPRQEPWLWRSTAWLARAVAPMGDCWYNLAVMKGDLLERWLCWTMT